MSENNTFYIRNLHDRLVICAVLITNIITSLRQGSTQIVIAKSNPAALLVCTV
jgi:hypothetical protein